MNDHERHLKQYEERFNDIICSNLLYTITQYTIIPFLGMYETSESKNGSTIIHWEPDCFSSEPKKETDIKNRILGIRLPKDLITKRTVSKKHIGSTSEFIEVKSSCEHEFFSGADLLLKITDACRTFFEALTVINDTSDRKILSMNAMISGTRRNKYDAMVKNRKRYFDEKHIDDSRIGLVPIDSNRTKRQIIDSINRVYAGLYESAHIDKLADIFPLVYPLKPDTLYDDIQAAFVTLGLSYDDRSIFIMKTYLEIMIPVYAEIQLLIAHRINRYDRCDSIIEFLEDLNEVEKEDRADLMHIRVCPLHDTCDESFANPNIFTNYYGRYFIVG